MSNTWLCPLCGLKRMKYGATCDKPTTCDKPMNINGAWYRTNYYTADKRKSERGLGISEISNENEGM